MKRVKKIDPLILFGKTEKHTLKVPGENNHQMHPKALKAYIDLQKKSVKNGFNLQLVSSFRSYERQLFIWNEKVLGKRVLWNHRATKILSPEDLSPEKLLKTILRWSAIPGGSRHHWGTDIDIYDAKAMNLNQIQLTPKETAYDGPMGPFYEWLDELLVKDRAEGFFRPYQNDEGMISPERWHLSYAPVANEMQKNYTYELYYAHIQTSPEILLQDPLLKVSTSPKFISQLLSTFITLESPGL